MIGKIKKALLPILLFSLFSFLTLSSLYLFWIREKDFQKYHTLIDRRKAFFSSANDTSHQSEQLRTGVQKEIWITSEEGKRQHVRISSKGSCLFLKQHKNKLQVIEKLSDIECWIQDKITLDDKQGLRYFTAQEGKYSYTSHQFIAREIQMNFLTEQGHEIPKFFNPELSFLSGSAKKVHFQLGKKTPLFHAYHFSAQLDTKKEGLE